MTELHSWSVSQDLTERAGRLRVEVSDARGDLRPLAFPAGTEVDLLSTSGRGLALVAALADHGDCVPHPPSGR
ncbi:hypothetical protein ACFW5X_05770 [Streptomyces albogriseolus]|uniref:hypothetical protein n=1 Tax=Streptomyces TaxID=1883 RepID=UPI002A74BE4C|nr:hypothetical protein [Streptomyces sp. CL7]WPP32649.1 hypothetical protein SJH97_26435 [Streptomyces sp. CL7]